MTPALHPCARPTTLIRPGNLGSRRSYAVFPGRSVDLLVNRTPVNPPASMHRRVEGVSDSIWELTPTIRSHAAGFGELIPLRTDLPARPCYPPSGIKYVPGVVPEGKSVADHYWPASHAFVAGTAPPERPGSHLLSWHVLCLC